MLWPLSVVKYQRTVGYPSTSWASCFYYIACVGVDATWGDEWSMLGAVDICSINSTDVSIYAGTVADVTDELITFRTLD